MAAASSISRRSLFTVTLTLLCFLGLTGWLLDRAFRDSAIQGEQQRLESALYGLLAATDITPQGRLTIPNFLTDERFNRPGSGLYAVITAPEELTRWRSRSLLGKALPGLNNQAIGTRSFYSTPGEGYFIYSAGIAWEIGNGEEPFTFHIMSSPDLYQAQVNSFRHSLWSWFAILTLILLAMQVIVLKWSLSPLQHVAADLHAVENGEQQQLSGDYPDELSGLTDNLNRLIATRDQQLARYRNALDDLAHSLKTPLAVMRGLDFSHSDDSRKITHEQTEHMTRMVDYHLQRAATAGPTHLPGNTYIKPVVARLLDSLHKVYPDKTIECKTEVNDELSFSIEENDLMELMGNLLDNAFKWAQSHITITAATADDQLTITIEDDGPGISEQLARNVLQRGVRADQTIDGQGIGLAIVADITHAYNGTIKIAGSATGGSCISISFPP